MDTLFIKAEYTGKVELCNDALDYLRKKKYSRIAMYASIQFVNKLEIVKKQLAENNIAIITSKPNRANAVSQLLGCDNYHHSLNLKEEELTEIEAYLYIGDGKFHPLTLVFAQKDTLDKKEVIVNNPIQNKMFLVSEADVKTILNKYKSSLMKFLTANRIGVIVTIKPGQEQFKAGLILEKKYPNKKFYYFIDNVISFDQLENFPFIEVWVNTACPRVGFDDQEKFRKGVVNLNDAMRAEEILGKKKVF